MFYIGKNFDGAKMKLRRVCAVLTGVTLLTISNVAADPFVLSGDALRRAVSGKTVYLKTTFGIEFPIRYRRNGTMSLNKSVVAKIAQAGGFANDRGVWWVRDDRLCQRWKKWLGGRSVCFELKRDGKTVYWRSNSGGSGTARIGR